MIELGGNILLDGFEEIEPAQLIVIKKMVGNFAKTAQDKINFEKFKVTKNENSILIEIIKGDKRLEHNNENNNLFYSLSNAALGVLKKI